MLKTLLANVGSYKKDTLLTPLFVSGEVVMDVIMPLIMAAMIDQGIAKSDAGAIMKYGLLLFVCFVEPWVPEKPQWPLLVLPGIYAIIFFSASKAFPLRILIAFPRLV